MFTVFNEEENRYQLVEEPDPSLRDTWTKFEVYGNSGVKEYWITNPVEQNLIVYILNASGRYQGGKMYADGDRLKSFAIKGFEST